eukprot:Tamp_28876.p1 GENE.Tamp_28876~~Tamp_28876.p1  ORF type:complete len:151 (+),score=2.17 Tamp_28876:167-619(+)
MYLTGKMIGTPCIRRSGTASKCVCVGVCDTCVCDTHTHTRYIHTRTHTRTRHIHTCTRIHTHVAYTLARTHTLSLTHTHTHTHQHTQGAALQQNPQCLEPVESKIAVYGEEELGGVRGEERKAAVIAAGQRARNQEREKVFYVRQPETKP